ncbi:MAG: phage head closure protein [Ramlibacter sp.]
MVEARRLTQRVTLQQPGTSVDAAGQPIAGWTTLATVWASILYQTGAEANRADAPVSVAKASIRIRRRTDVTAGMRAVCGATVFDIRAVLPDEQSRAHVDLACETGANNG